LPERVVHGQAECCGLVAQSSAREQPRGLGRRFAKLRLESLAQAADEILQAEDPSVAGPFVFEVFGVPLARYENEL